MKRYLLTLVTLVSWTKTAGICRFRGIDSDSAAVAIKQEVGHGVNRGKKRIQSD